MKIAIIGGTGFYEPGLLDDENDLPIKTPYGEVTLTTGRYRGREVFFLPRHGTGHTVPPHLINYRANIWALREVGVTKVLATAAVGSLHEALAPGETVLVNQFIDFTTNRIETFHDGGPSGVLHVDMSTPYCPALSAEVYQTSVRLGIAVHRTGTYVCTDGPRYETPAEVRMFRKWGGDIVGMTSVPEVVLAREAELCYATVATITNHAAGITKQPLSHLEVVEAMNRSQSVLRQLIFTVVSSASEERPCTCARAAAEAGSLGKKQ